MRAHRARWPIATQCRTLEVPASGYYAWLSRTPSARARRDREISARLVDLHRRSRGIYGSPRLPADLAAKGIRIGRKRVARLRKEHGLRGISRHRGVRTTRGNGDAVPAPDLVRRAFRAEGPNRLWVADITYVPTWSGFLNFVVVLDVWSRRIVGWAMRTHLRTDLVLEVLDNALAESFFATLECELLERNSYRHRVEARLSVFDYLEGFYNPHRRHSALGNVSSMRFEVLHAASDPDDAPCGAPRFRGTEGLLEPLQGSSFPVHPVQ